MGGFILCVSSHELRPFVGHEVCLFVYFQFMVLGLICTFKCDFFSVLEMK